MISLCNADKSLSQKKKTKTDIFPEDIYVLHVLT